ncbi:hypothetical protein F4779DRAFT_597145 [Xylariaceae sp. FL0662B]|nr:hypothetical protein F4779DRAFT_597145 [Xylariaceae sp. FL0662B]
MSSYNLDSESASNGLDGSNMNSDAQSNKLSIDELDIQHRELFVRALWRVVSTDIAELTYAQIIDGLPLVDTVNDTCVGGLSNRHPLYDMHEQICNGVMERTEEIRANFDPGVLKFDSQLIYAYQRASAGLRAFKTRMIEMVAGAIHQIAALLYHRDTSLHKEEGITTWAPSKDDTLFWNFFPDGPPPTLFRHEWYNDHEQYPDGVGDMVGYWAESRILGEVVLFDRGTSTREPDPEAVFSHSDRYEITYRIYQLLESQKQQLLDFLLSDDPGPSPLPILGDTKNDRRVDPEEPIENTGIYRYIWERKPLPPDGPDARSRDVWDKLEYPTRADFEGARKRARERRNTS